MQTSIHVCIVYIVGSHSLCSWAGLNEAIQDQSILTRVYYVTILKGQYVGIEAVQALVNITSSLKRYKRTR